MPTRSSILRPLALLPLAVLLSGCALTSNPVVATAIKGLSIHGNVHGGQQPVVGSHVYLFAADTLAYGNPSNSLLSSASTGYADTVGAYVPTDASGSWDISGDYACTPGTQVYLYALGGDAGAGPNSAVGLMAVLGNCPSSGNFATAVPYISINEISTVAAAYAMAPFALDATDVASSGSTLALTGIANAFANASNLADLPSGSALATTPQGNATVPTSTINTLANVLAACINSTGASDPNCLTLLGDATSDGTLSGTAPTDTATAMINIARNPGANMSDLYNLPSPTSPFAPTLAPQPNDFTIALTYTDPSLNAPGSVTFDAAGNAWIANFGNNSVTLLSSLGVPLSNSPMFNNGLSNPSQIAIDQSGNAWVANAGAAAVSEFDLNGNALGSLSTGSSNTSGAIAVDPSGNVWAASSSSNELSLLTMSGTPALSQFTTNLDSPDFVAFDASGNAWVANQLASNVAIFDNSGNPLSNSPIGGNGIDSPTAVSIDNFGNGWVGNFASNSISVFDMNGNEMASSPFTGGGVSQPLAIAFDGLGNVWVANDTGGVTAMTGSGTPLVGSPFNLAGISQSRFLAVDGSGSVWVANQGANTVVQLIGSAAPAVTPIAYAVTTGTIGTRP